MPFDRFTVGNILVIHRGEEVLPIQSTQSRAIILPLIYPDVPRETNGINRNHIKCGLQELLVDESIVADCQKGLEQRDILAFDQIEVARYDNRDIYKILLNTSKSSVEFQASVFKAMFDSLKKFNEEQRAEEIGKRRLPLFEYKILTTGLIGSSMKEGVTNQQSAELLFSAIHHVHKDLEGTRRIEVVIRHEEAFTAAYNVIRNKSYLNVRPQLLGINVAAPTATNQVRFLNSQHSKPLQGPSQ